ncbi:unnamed protein product [marine sediment metagenome]|uniref:Uncharacterized protein n=1 Tax=marine sediment metagenome TaxID=412755 RepID=X1B339_9ZZZZ
MKIINYLKKKRRKKKNKDEHKDTKLTIQVNSEGVGVESEGLHPKKIEDMINRMILKHKDFMIMKRRNRFGSYVE